MIGDGNARSELHRVRNMIHFDVAALLPGRQEWGLERFGVEIAAPDLICGAPVPFD